MSAVLQTPELYAVLGNPVSHSLSPRIHTHFAAQAAQVMQYQAIEVPLDQFNQQLFEMQSKGYKGANVTVPFKQQAWEICDQLSSRARDAGAVNTLTFLESGEIAGDNTDGVGLVRDLLQNLRLLMRERRILILGAGGAVRGVLSPILEQKPKKLTIANRSLDKAEDLATLFSNSGSIDVSAYEDLGNEQYDLIINGTAAGLNNQVPPIPATILGVNSVCYDMMYNLQQDTAFVSWALNHGAVDAYDGLGMLVEQAAESFQIWRGVSVDTGELMESLRSP
ncbi:MAG: shikimate dehydrogenase [Pseudomonadota bacterium]